MDINVASAAIEAFLAGHVGRGGRKAAEVRVHPSGDDMNAIKIWVNLDPAADGDDLHAWCADAEAAIRKALPAEVSGLQLELRADAM